MAESSSFKNYTKLLILASLGHFTMDLVQAHNFKKRSKIITFQPIFWRFGWPPLEISIWTGGSGNCGNNMGRERANFYGTLVLNIT